MNNLGNTLVNLMNCIVADAISDFLVPEAQIALNEWSGAELKVPTMKKNLPTPLSSVGIQL
jgi:hypothetical protein